VGLLRRIPLLVVLALVAGLGPAAVSAEAPPTARIHAHFVDAEKATHYTVEFTGTIANPTYSWSLQPPTDDPTCNKFEVTSAGNEAIWHHADSDGCHHFGVQHNGTVTVVVLATGWKCVATYFGTLDGDGTAAACTERTPPLKNCKCTNVTMKTSPENFTDNHTFEFAVHWTIHCKGAGGTCRGEIQALDPVEVRGVLHFQTDMEIKTNKGKPLACAGRCGRLSKGTFHIVGKSKNDLGRTERRGKTFLFKFKLWCADKGHAKKALPGAEMTIVFDKRGFLDRKKSDFNG
jgi:hypothetical protein